MKKTEFFEMTPSEIEPLWMKILQRLQGENIETFNDLNPPCSEDSILEVEKHLGFILPENIRILYRLNDGQKGVGKSLFQIEKSKFNLAIGLVGGLRLLHNERDFTFMERVNE